MEDVPKPRKFLKKKKKVFEVNLFPLDPEFEGKVLPQPSEAKGNISGLF